MNQPLSLPRVHDVAARAGVSVATVSRYVNKSGYVAQETARRVQEAIDALGYFPNLLAGELATSRSRLVSLLIPQLSQSPFNSTIEALVASLREDGYTAMLGITGPGEAAIDSLIDTALGRRAEGIILTGVLTDEAVRRRLGRASSTVIETWGLPADPIDVAIGFSHEAVGRVMALYAQRRGYRRPLLVTTRATRSELRKGGFVGEWQDWGGGQLQELEVESPPRFSQARAVFRYMRELDDRPDLIVCGSDGLAQGVLIEAISAGLSIPHDLAVLGFGNLALASDMRPSITTIAVDGARIGRAATDILRARAEGAARLPTVIDVGFSLIERESA